MALIMGIQIIAIFFALFMMYYTFLNYRRHQLKKRESVLWLAIWFCFLAMSVFPSYLEQLARSLNIYRTMDFLIILGFFFIILATFYNFVQVRKNNYKLEAIVRKLAYRKAESGNKKK